MIAKIIKNTFFYSPVVCYSNIEGQYCYNKTFFLGAKAGPSIEISNLLHEIAHFAEREPEKLITFPSSGWGFYKGKFWQIGNSWGYEPFTDQQVWREARVWAFQLSAQIQFGLNDSAYELVKSAVYLPAWCYYSSKHRHNTAKAIYHLAKWVERVRVNYSWNRLVEDYQYRISLIEKLTNTD